MKTILKPLLSSIFFFSFLFQVMTLSAQTPVNDSKIKNSIIKIYSVTSHPDYYRPWQHVLKRQTGSGCVIEGNQILTNAHVVANQTFIEVRKQGFPRRYKARVFMISHEADLALLKVEDKTFFDGIEPLQFGGLPDIQQEVLVYGFPTGGDTISITKGIISRIEHVRYSHSSLFFLAGQIDAAINPGNSGGPVIADQKLVGIAMQGRRDAENIGYLIPVPVINHFLIDIKDGSYGGFPELGIITQEMENPDMKAKHRVPDSKTGVLITHIFHSSPAKGILKEGDIILSIDGHKVSDDGTVEFRKQQRTRMGHFIDMHQVEDKVNIEFLRGTLIEKTEITLTKIAEDILLVSPEQYDEEPEYFIYGGLVFSPLTKNLLAAWGNNWRSRAPLPLITQLLNRPTESRQQVVILLQVLAADINKGYHDISTWVVDNINGEKYKNFHDFVRLVQDNNDPYQVFKDSNGFQLVIDQKKAEASHMEVLQRYRIPKDRSINN
jgi:S1-C subfamily serine protease